MTDIFNSIASAREVLWTNALRTGLHDQGIPEQFDGKPIGPSAIQEAQARFERFAPLLAELFPELGASNGQIESALMPIPAMQLAIGLPDGKGTLWLKTDHNLPVAGSIKARGGFHEVFEVAERLALQHRLIGKDEDYRALAGSAARTLFAKHQFAVGSTGNLGLSIGVMAASLGFRAVVHMSADAKEWKKARLRNKGVEVVEHAGDYEQAVSQGRQLALQDPLCHFVDDEHSTSLFLGYAAAAFHLRKQLIQRGITVNAAHPLLVYIPCGVGGAPAGIAWGLHHIWGNDVHCYFAEPVQSPCFLVQMLAPHGEHPSVYDYGLTNRTEADGLAVPRASVLAAQTMKHVVAGVFTVEDSTLFGNLKLLQATEGMQIEPSAAAGLSGALWMKDNDRACAGATHIVWTTGGSLVPHSEYQKYLSWSHEE